MVARSIGELLWTVTGWICSVGVTAGGSFELWVSPEFLRVAKDIARDNDQKSRWQASARFILSQAGFQVEDYQTFLKFGEWGLMHFEAPGNACGMDFEGDDVLLEGATFQPHNVDNPRQQSALMAIWMKWAGAVEAEIWCHRQHE